MSTGTRPGAAGKRAAPGRLYYRIGEVSEMTGVPPYTLRHWENEFPTLNPMKNESSQRLYRPADIEMVRQIQKLLHKDGFTTAGARNWLRSSGNAGPSRSARPGAPAAAVRPAAPAETAKPPASAGKQSTSGKQSPDPKSNASAATPPKQRGAPSESAVRRARELLDLMDRNDELLERLASADP